MIVCTLLAILWVTGIVTFGVAYLNRTMRIMITAFDAMTVAFNNAADAFGTNSERMTILSKKIDGRQNETCWCATPAVAGGWCSTCQGVIR